MSLLIFHLRFSISVLEILKFEWQCNQYLELNPTCGIAHKKINRKGTDVFIRQGHGPSLVYIAGKALWGPWSAADAIILFTWITTFCFQSLRAQWLSFPSYRNIFISDMRLIKIVVSRNSKDWSESNLSLDSGLTGWWVRFVSSRTTEDISVQES